MAQYPTEYRYTRSHEWALVEDDIVKVGITTYATAELKDVTMVDLPGTGEEIQAEESFGAIESVKAANDLYAPVSGEIIEVNTELDASPEMVNESPYDRGWMVIIKPNDIREVSRLMDSMQYEDYLNTL